MVSIGKNIGNKVVCHLVGNISRVNLWSKAKNGDEIKQIAKDPGSENGDLIAWYIVKNYIPD